MARIIRKPSVKELSLRAADLSKDRLEGDPRFLRRIERARASLQAGRVVRLEDAETE